MENGSSNATLLPSMRLLRRSLAIPALGTDGSTSLHVTGLSLLNSMWWSTPCPAGSCMSPVFCMEEWTSRGASDTEHVRNCCRRHKNGTTLWTNLMLERYWSLIAPRARSVCLSQRGAVRLRAAWTYRAGSVRVKSQRFPRTKTSGRPVGKAEGEDFQQDFKDSKGSNTPLRRSRRLRDQATIVSVIQRA